MYSVTYVNPAKMTSIVNSIIRTDVPELNSISVPVIVLWYGSGGGEEGVIPVHAQHSFTSETERTYVEERERDDSNLS